MNRRFTLDGSDELEKRLSGICRQARHGLAAIIPATRLEGILLGGGYGRGEGGVLRGPEGDEPYNDLEFYVLVRGVPTLNQRRYGSLVSALGHRLSEAAGIEVEFHLLSMAKLERSPVNMFYYDLVMGHHWVLGEEKLLERCGHHRAAQFIPLCEATRLLMNRCSGLLFAKERLCRERFTDEASDFVGRNLAKAKLAFGDVVLTVFGQYHWSCRKRAQRLRELRVADEMPWLAEVGEMHEEGVNFKLHPERSRLSRCELYREHACLAHLGQQVWLWLENRRLGIRFATVREYALSGVNKCPETKPWRNWLINGKVLGVESWLRGKGGRYGRERLLNALPLLLWEEGIWNRSETLKAVQEELATDGGDFVSLVKSYEWLWSKFN